MPDKAEGAGKSFLFFHLLKIFFLVSPVGYKGNLSLLEVLYVFQGS